MCNHSNLVKKRRDLTEKCSQIFFILTLRLNTSLNVSNIVLNRRFLISIGKSMQRIGNLNWENITYDHDISGLIRGLTDWGVIEGGTVVGNKLQPVQAIVPLVRSNGQKILAFFESDEVIDLPTTGDYKVYIEVDQSKIDFGGNNAEDGTGIASIKTWPTLPSQNFLLLASVTSWVAKDERNLIPKVGQIAQRTTTLESKVATQEEKVGKLEEAGTPDHLWIKAIVAEAFKENDEAYEYHLPLASEVTSDCPIWKTNLTKGIHIPRFSNWVEFNSLELFLKKVWEPSQNLVVEIRKAKKVTNSGVEYVVGGELLTFGIVPYAEITTTYQMKTVTLKKTVAVTKDEFVIIVLKQQNETVNASNYFCIGVSKNPSFGYWVVCVENSDNHNKTYANVVCSSQWWYTNAIFWLWGSSFSGQKKRTLPDRQNFSSWFPKNSIQEIVAPADNLTIKFKVKCSNWKMSGGGGGTRWGFSIILWNQTLASYGYGQTVETTTTATLSTRMLESAELYIQGNSENYSTYYTSCDVEISREITSKPWEILARSIYSRKATAPWEKWEFTVFGYHKDRTWKEEEVLWAWPVTVAFSGSKEGNSTEEKKFRSPRVSLCKMAYSLSSSYYWNDSSSWIEVWHNWVKIQTLSRNSDGYVECYFILPKWEITLKLYTRHRSWYNATMNYNLYIQ